MSQRAACGGVTKKGTPCKNGAGCRHHRHGTTQGTTHGSGGGIDERLQAFEDLVFKQGGEARKLLTALVKEHGMTVASELFKQMLMRASGFDSTMWANAEAVTKGQGIFSNVNRPMIDMPPPFYNLPPTTRPLSW